MPSSTDAPTRRCAAARPLLALAWLATLAGCNTPMPPEPAPTVVSTPVPVARLLESAAAGSAAAAAASAAAEAASANLARAAPARQLEDASAQLLGYADRLRELGPAELARDQVRLSDAADEPLNRLQLVLLLAFTRQNSDLPRALVLLEPLTRPATPAPWRGLARLLQDRLLEQRRLEEQSERQSQQVREQQRRIDQLSNQLEALKAIERSIGGRPPGAAPPAVPLVPGRSPP